MTVETSTERDERYTVLSHPWRRYTLSVLRDERRDTTLCQLANHVAESEHGPSDTDRVKMLLHHTHLPKLDAAGLVSYDAKTKYVAANTSRPLDELLEETL